MVLSELREEFIRLLEQGCLEDIEQKNWILSVSAKVNTQEWHEKILASYI